jgi:ferritin-like metal-binding protein YciE
MAINTVNDKYLHELGDIYDAEHQFLEAQQEALEKATDSTLREGLQHHIEQTQTQIENLETVYEHVGHKPERVTCEAAKGIVREYQENLQDAGSDSIRDCQIGSSLSRMEHYEIAGYRSLITTVQQLGMEDVERLLQENLQQEEIAAQLLEENAPMLVKRALQHEK